METNWLVVIGSAIIPLLVGILWYNPRVFGTVWMEAAGMKQDDTKDVNMFLVLGLTLFLSVLVASALLYSVVHQAHIFSAVMGNPDLKDPNSALSQMLKTFMELYGSNFRTFKHGALHGTITGVTLALPVVAINALFERKSAKYIAIHAGYWIVSFALMGGVICAFA